MGKDARALDVTPVPVLGVAGLRRRHGPHAVLDGVDLDVRRGEVVAIVGASGAGKSTLLRCVMGLERYQEGVLTLLGRPPRSDGRRNQVALLFQGLNLYPDLRIGLQLVMHGATPGHARELLARVGLAEQFETPAGRLSRGEQQRVAMARALLAEPVLLLCDDIVPAGEPELQGEVVMAAWALADAGLALLIATPDPVFARQVADRVFMLHAGQLQEARPAAGQRWATAPPVSCRRSAPQAAPAR